VIEISKVLNYRCTWFRDSRFAVSRSWQFQRAWEQDASDLAS